MTMIEDVGAMLDATFTWLIRPSTAGTGEVGNFFFYSMPDNPDEAYAIYQYPGQAPQRNMRVGTIIEKPRIQVLARGVKVKPVMDNMMLIRNLLAGQQDVMIGGVHYLDIYPIAEPGEIGTDTKARQRISCNFQIEKEPG